MGTKIFVPMASSDINDVLFRLGYTIDESGFIIDKNGVRAQTWFEPKRFVKPKDIIAIAPDNGVRFITNDDELNYYLELMD